MYSHFIVNDNREQEENHNEIGEAEAIRLLAGTETETDEAHSRRVDWETHQRPPQGHSYAHHPEDAAKSEVKSNEEDIVYLKFVEWVYFPDKKDFASPIINFANKRGLAHPDSRI